MAIFKCGRTSSVFSHVCLVLFGHGSETTRSTRAFAHFLLFHLFYVSSLFFISLFPHRSLSVVSQSSVLLCLLLSNASPLCRVTLSVCAVPHTYKHLNTHTQTQTLEHAHTKTQTPTQKRDTNTDTLQNTSAVWSCFCRYRGGFEDWAAVWLRFGHDLAAWLGELVFWCRGPWFRVWALLRVSPSHPQRNRAVKISHTPAKKVHTALFLWFVVHCLSAFEHCRAHSSELLFPSETKLQATNYQVSWSLELLLVSSRTAHIPSGGFSFKTVNFVNPFQESDKLRFTSTFQQSFTRSSCNTFWSRQCMAVESGIFSSFGS